jgi:tetratricopeptide (TPR) repeat protein
VVALVVALLAFGYVFTLNPGLTEFKMIPGREPIRTSFALILFLFFMAGFGAAVFGTAFREALRSFTFWRYVKRSERKDEAQRLVVEGRGNAVLGKTGVARRLLKRAQRKAPGERYVTLEAARMELADGKLDLAERRLKGLLGDAPNSPEILSLLLDVYRQRKNFEGQVATLTRWLEVDPGHPAALRNLRELYAGAGNWAEAARVQGLIQSKVVARKERLAERKLLSLYRYREAASQPPARAKGTLERLVKEDEGFAPGHAALGEALLALGEKDAALQVWIRGYQISGQAGLLLKAEAVRERAGEAEEMLKLYRKLGKKGGTPVLLRARLLLQLERAQEALKLLEEDAQGVGGTRAGRLLVGEALNRLRSFDGAADAFRKAVFGAQADLPVAFVCDPCRHAVAEWAATCPACGAVDSLVMDVGALPPTAN